MPFLPRPLQRVFKPGFDAKWRIRFKAGLYGQFIRRDEAYAFNIIYQSVRVLFQLGYAQRAVCVIKLHALRNGYAKFLQRKHDFAHTFLHGERLSYFICPEAAYAGYFTQTLRLVFKYVERIHAKC